MALEHRLVVGQSHRLRRKAHLLPRVQILLLRCHRQPVSQPQRPHIRRDGPLTLRVLFQVLHCGPLGVDAPSGPGVALLLDLPQGRPPPLSVLPGDPLHAVIHQQEDHVRRQAQIIVQSQQNTHIRRGEPLPQLFFHLRRQQTEFLAALQPPGNVIPLVAGLFISRLRDLLRCGRQQPQVPQGLLRRLDAALFPSQLSRQRPGLHRSVMPQKRQI